AIRGSLASQRASHRLLVVRRLFRTERLGEPGVTAVASDSAKERLHPESGAAGTHRADPHVGQLQSVEREPSGLALHAVQQPPSRPDQLDGSRLALQLQRYLAPPLVVLAQLHTDLRAKPPLPEPRQQTH